ncbi:kelch domain-containing protein 7A [Dicentrarchus labrax]|uniref:Kelch domain containing 7A n=1 Tax=Dicentrarchus labrax TaxID=13489 RepID=A0A8P4FZD9_DICLA|nr:kelch domain-containing protein 7A [Dicentrarchus labrax]
MPIADLLGVQFDMQLLLKLSLSVAAVLLVSWAYRFYSSRDAKKIPVCDKDNKEPENATCQNCKTTLRCQNPPKYDTDDGGKQLRPSHTDSATDDLTSDSTKETAAEVCPRQGAKSEDAFNMTYSDQDISFKGEILTHQKQAKVSTSNISFGSALNLPRPTESGMVSTTGRRSPCFLQKLEGSVGVGRELRQDLERQGAYSSFLSKAEIKVKDANVVLEGTGDQIVRGKIYDYYVESSSHSITDSNTVLGQFERNCESQPVEFGSHGSSLTESPSSLSPIIMRDLVLPQSSAEDPSTLGNLKLRHPARPVLQRKESYLSAAEQSELSIPFLTSRASTPMTHSPASTSDESVSVHTMIFSSTDSKDLNMRERADLETVAGAPFLHLPAKILNSKDLESLKSKLDLGNCLETLYLAKKHGQPTVQQAALGVMSDNYLQVLRDPNLYGRLMAGEREQIQKQRMRGRKLVMVADMDPQDWARNTGGPTAETEQRRTSSAVYYYDDYKDTWHTLCLIPQEVISKACAMCTMDNYLFVTVGCQGTDREMTPSKRVFCYNPLTSIWKEISPMNEARPRCKLAALEGYIYAIGGECLSSVERYDPRLDRWTFVAPLPNDTFAVAHHVTVCNGELFVSGGTLRYMLLRYSPKTNTWRPSLLVGSKDRTADMVAVGRFLYRFDVNSLLGVSVYRYHTVARLWYECSSKRLMRCPAFQCVTMDDTIYCVSRQFTMRFEADEISPAFIDENLSVLSAAKGILFPFVLSLPDKKPRQTSV